MSLAAYALRRTVGALLVLLVVIALVQFAVSQAVPSSSIPSLVEWKRSWQSFGLAALIAVAAVVLVSIAWRLAGTRGQRAGRADEVR
jgi:hypothetical protein